MEREANKLWAFLFLQKIYSIRQIKATEDSRGMNKSELHSPQEQTKHISPSFMTSPTIKSIIKAIKKSIWKEPSGDNGSHCALYKELSLNAGLDPNLQEDSLGLRTRNTLNYSGKSNLVFKVFPTLQSISDVFQSDGS